MNRTLLVAQREFVENLRTKTFWLGILAFPVILVLSVVVMKFFHDAKEVRRYAVVDLSEGQWLSEAIDREGASSDFRDVLSKGPSADGAEQVRAQLESDRQVAVDEVLAGIREYRESLDTNDILRGMLDEYEKALEPRRGETLTPGELVLATVQPVTRWFKEQDPETLKARMSGLSHSKFKRVSLEELGIEVADPPDPDVITRALGQRLNDDSLFAYFVIGADPVASAEGSRYVSNNRTDAELKSWFSRLATKVVRERRIAQVGIDREDAAFIQRDFAFEGMKADATTGEATGIGDGDKFRSLAPIGFVYLLWIAVLMASQMLLTNTVEEKSNRIIEVLLSSVSPLQLMAGKVWGIAATGLTIVGSWAVVALIGVNVAPVLFPALEKFSLMEVIGDPLYLASFIGYFLAGYLLYAAMLVAIGSVCNSLKEAQNLMQPVIILLIVPLLALLPIINEPNGTVAKVLTYIPLFTPFAMMNRAAGPPPAWEYLVSGVLLVVAIVIAFWAAGKVFRIGVLMTGKPPKLREILGWIRAPVGAVAVSNHPRSEVGADQVGADQIDLDQPDL